MTGAAETLKLLIGSSDDTRDLPPRVREAVRAQQDRSERLIGWVQLALVAVFATLYAVAPKTHMNEIWMSPVPMALLLYALFTLLRLYLSYRISLPDWYLGLSALVDLALLMTLIWYFHIQYEQPPPFYLKAPTMLYVFIFIALRALRFEPRYVLRTGLAAAVGWTILLLYALYAGGGEPPVTRDYVAYLTGNLILLGGEIDKILAILVVTGLLTAAQLRGRKLLLQAVADAHAHAELSRFFAPEIAQKIASGEASAGAGEEVTASVLYIDIRDFTALSNRVTPGELMGLLADYQSRMTPVIAAHGGTVERFTGDGVMASFGAIKSRPDYALCAVRAAEAVLREADAWAEALKAAGREPVRIGLALTTGRLILGAVGGGGRFEYTLVGEPANRAAKIEKHNKDFGCRALADAETLNAARLQGWTGCPKSEHRAVCVADVRIPVDLAILD
jgi:adenylate cyclase